MDKLRWQKLEKELENTYECPYCGEKTLKLNLTETRGDDMNNWHYECYNFPDCNVWGIVFEKRLG